MDLHRPFKMDSPSYLPPPLASPALMVLASTAEAGRDASVPCQAPRPFGVPVSMEKDLHLPFPSASYTFTSMYQRQGSISGAFPSRDFPASLLHLHPQFTPPNLDSTTLSMLNHSGVGAFRPFSSPQEERESGLYQSAFSPAKRLKSCFPEVEGKEFDFGSPAGSLKAGEDSGRKLFSMSGLLSDGEASSSPEERKEHNPSHFWNHILPLSSGVHSSSSSRRRGAPYCDSVSSPVRPLSTCSRAIGEGLT
uniref:Ring finger protein 220 n=1 Tax=Takifugu rubripes TaxID=31033 RepID=A0A674PJH8_TAKRU